jgi:hypothetical protein
MCLLIFVQNSYVSKQQVPDSQIFLGTMRSLSLVCKTLRDRLLNTSITWVLKYSSSSLPNILILKQIKETCCLDIRVDLEYRYVGNYRSLF